MNKTIFNIPNLKGILILGYSPIIEDLLHSISDLKLKVEIVCNSDQAVHYHKDISVKVFDQLDKDFIAYIEKEFSSKNTLFVSFGARWVFKNEIIKNVMANQLVNFHGSRLPLDAGGGGFSWRILNKDRINNLLVHLVDEFIDNGPIIMSKSSIFPAKLKIPKDFESFYWSSFKPFFQEFISKLYDGDAFELKIQPKYIGSYMPRLKTDLNGWIDWNLRSDQLEVFINAFDDPYNGASTLLNNKRVRIKKVQIHGGEQATHPFLAGLISRINEGWLLVNTSDGLSLIVEVVEDENGNNIVSQIKVGSRFHTTSQKLSESLTYRHSY